MPRIDNQRRIRFNSDINESWFSTISELLAVITVACIFLPSVAMVREKETGYGGAVARLTLESLPSDVF